VIGSLGGEKVDIVAKIDGTEGYFGSKIGVFSVTASVQFLFGGRYSLNAG